MQLPLYVGALGVLVTTGMALSRTYSGALTVAFAGALVSTAAEAWHAYSHLRMDTHTAPIAGTLSFAGFLVAVIGVWMDGRRRAPSRIERRRAA